MFNWTNVSFPKITDVFRLGEDINFYDVFFYVYIQVLGIWFFAFILGAIGGAIYIKTENTAVTAAFFIIATVLLGGIYPVGVLPNIFVYIIGLFVAFILGLLLYNFFIRGE
jgi:glycerol uptake facilitator-like aquaporin